MNIEKTSLSRENQAVEDFRSWFDSEREKGLVDVKFAIANTVSDKAVTRNVLHKMITSERMIKAGIVERHLEESFVDN